MQRNTHWHTYVDGRKGRRSLARREEYGDVRPTTRNGYTERLDLGDTLLMVAHAENGD